ncbi:MAG: isoprenylcysteine carboxylmethyltransferase family protein [Candidatus Bathyarchaeota archaeon]|nr:isoprenylcysteine carboxylmethyltransferase family protein [Candidatus Bathyarchaeota archaeon]
MMSLIPEFELGVYNAWILVLSFFVFCTGLPSLITRVFITNKNPKDSDEPSSFDEQEKKLQNIFIIALAASVIYSIFLPLELGTAWFYVGVSISLLGMIFNIMAEMNFRTTSIDKPVTKGVYRISRNPQLFGAFLAFIGISVACASWLFLLFTLAMIAAYNILVVSEERWCLEKYGTAYREYMNRTPKWIGIPKSKKRD